MAGIKIENSKSRPKMNAHPSHGRAIIFSEMGPNLLKGLQYEDKPKTPIPRKSEPKIILKASAG